MQIEMMPVGSITPYEKNPRKNKQSVDAVAESIKEFGFKVPIIIDKDGVIVAGHTRLMAAKKLKMTEVPIIRADDLTPEQIKAFRLADNKVGESSEWDFDLLKEELDGIFDIDMSAFGFDFEELPAEAVDDDYEVEPPKDPKSKRGDIYILGNHRVMCGDSTDVEDVRKLLGGVQADLYLTDPPYNVDYVGKTKDALKIENDKKDDAEFRTFLDEAFLAAQANMKAGAVFISGMRTRRDTTSGEPATISDGWSESASSGLRTRWFSDGRIISGSMNRVSLQERLSLRQRERNRSSS